MIFPYIMFKCKLMRRKIMTKLQRWQEKSNRMPLLLNGARQVGKTYILQQFGKTYYENVAYFNLENNLRARTLFDGDLEGHALIQYLEALCQTRIIPGQTLIILDEIQACERALTALKAFCEDAPEYHVAAAGSLLGVAINREHFSFPVGKVDELTMYPMDFEEFLWALGQESLSEQIRQHFSTNEKLVNALHEIALECLRQYMIVGGMPAAVREFCTSKSFIEVAEIQQRILNEYIADMAKYATPTTAVKIRACFNSIPAQLAKENHKFQYKVVQRGGSASLFGEAIEWLKYAGVIIKCEKIGHGFLPIAAYTSLSDFKIYMSDVGLLTLKSGMPSSLLLSPIDIDNTFMGAIVENYVAQALVANGHGSHYWRNNNTAELDFVIQLEDKVVPIEVKKGLNTRAKSLSVFMANYHTHLSIRISRKNFGIGNGIKSVPLYAVFCI